MPTAQENYLDLDLFDADGDKIGTVTDIISDPHTLERLFVVVKTGFFKGERVVPVAAVRPRADQLVTDIDKDTVMSAPKVPNHIAPEGDDLEEIFLHFGMRAPARS